MDTVTLLISIAAFLISVFSWVAAVHANRAALFERRFEVYTDAKEFIAGWTRHGRPDMDLLPKLVDAWNRSHFLFPPAVTQHLRKIWTDGVRTNFHQMVLSGDANGDRARAIAESMALTQEHTDHDRFRDVFLPHLKVSDGYLSLPEWAQDMFTRSPVAAAAPATPPDEGEAPAMPLPAAANAPVSSDDRASQ